ncbi:non-homologous end-joining DNA ligase [Microbacterium sp. A84]|uniref:non-homologous end-joining DNA ligase n=1 Tax=Microbacterium sp. A84 TaxID=3450715 RepID=UPI003F41B6F9
MPGDAQVVEVDGRRLRLTNLDKVMYPATGTTKGEVIAYYTRVAPRMLPLLADRPVTRKRWVHGVGTADAPAEPFFAKQVEPGTPEWVRRLPIEHSGGAKDYPLVQDLPTLVWLAQVASIELHVPQWRFVADGSQSTPDRLVLDLDPGPGADLALCAHIAGLARVILTDIGLTPVPVTSGSKGLHLYAQLDGTYTSDQASALAKELARAIEADHADIATSTMAKAARGGKVFLDWSQNSGSKTTISPYSLRGRAHPTAAAPRTWDELDDPQLRQLTFEEVASRVEAGVDPFSVSVSAPGRSFRQAPAAKTRPVVTAAPAARATAASGSVTPMLAEPGTPGLARALREPWSEIKWDGIRAIGNWRNGRMQLHARSGIDITARYPELTADGAPHFAAAEAIVDGEIVALDASGRPSFSLLQHRMHLTRGREIEREVVRTPVAYYLFDLLHLDGHDLTRLPLHERRALLEALMESVAEPVTAPPVFDDLDAALTMSREHGLEGVVVKESGSQYRPGVRSGSWLKIKHTRTQEVVIAGIRPGKGNRAGSIGSLLLGVPDASADPATGQLRYVGRVGTGFDDRTLRDLTARLEPLRTDTNPLQGVPDADARDALWVQPLLIGEVEFANWTPDGSLRHASWRGLRPDKSASEITIE